MPSISVEPAGLDSSGVTFLACTGKKHYLISMRNLSTNFRIYNIQQNIDPVLNVIPETRM